MELLVNRFKFTPNSTLGRLFVNESSYCYTLEDTLRDGVKVEGKTGIPKGTYKVIIDASTRFKRDMPHVLNVPGFEGIRIHAGNTDADTEGCLLVGKSLEGDDFIGRSKEAFDGLFSKIKMALDSGETVTLRIHEDGRS